MKRTILSLLLSLNTIFLFAGAGIFDSFAYVNANGSGNTFYDLDAATMNVDFSGANLGSFSPGSADLFLGGQIKTFKNNGTNVTGATINYRIYPVGAPSGAFTPIAYSFQINDVGGVSGDQQWGTDINGSNFTDNAVNILSGATLAAGTYSLEVYVEITTDGVNAPSNIFDNNGGSNYIATFEVTMALPVELVAFKANKKQKSIQLNWITTNEINNSHFDIQKSKDSRTWETIKSVEGQGFSTGRIEYHFLDQKPFQGMNYYRLKQVDYDGLFEYSDLLSINFHKQDHSISIQPNPVQESLVISTEISQDPNINIVIYNLNGQKILEQPYVLNQDLNLNILIPGLYFIHVFDSNGFSIDQKSFVKQ